MPMRSLFQRWLMLWLLLSGLCASAWAQSVSSIAPRTCQPGKTTELTIQGADLNDSLRLATSSTDIALEVVSVEPTQALIRATVKDGAGLGPCAVAVAFSSGGVQQKLLMLDDLPPVTDNSANHSLAAAQVIEPMCAIEGTGDGPSSDFYRFSMLAGERRSFSIHTQELRSSLDPVLRLLKVDGSLVLQADDDELGPDCRFEFACEQAEDFILEVFDSRFASAGAAYHLRIGDFPLVTQGFPMAVDSVQATRVEFLDRQGDVAATQLISLANSQPGVAHVNVRVAERRSSTWVPLWSTTTPQRSEADALAEQLTIPVGINGRLDQAGQIDEFRLQGAKGQALHIQARTHSLGSPTLLHMRLLNAAGGTIAETKAAAADEWVLDGTPAEDGELRLQVSDLLQRGGPSFTYALDIASANSFSVALKADAAVRDQFAIELEHGAAAIDVEVLRSGYQGAIEFALVGPTGEAAPAGLRIVNPRIAAGATTARLFVHATEHWRNSDLVLARIEARKVEEKGEKGEKGEGLDSESRATMGERGESWVSSRALQRVKEPFMVNLPQCQEGLFVFGAVAPTPAPFAVTPMATAAVAVVELARPVNSHAATLAIQRLNPEFKAGIEVVSCAPSSDWMVEAKQEGENINLTLKLAAAVSTADSSPTTTESEPTTLPLSMYGEFNGRGQLVRYELPVSWFDPLQVELEFVNPLIRGGSARVRVRVKRGGNDPQAIALKLSGLPPGFTAPDGLAMTADQDTIEFELSVAEQASLDIESTTYVEASSQFAGQAFQIVTAVTWPQLLDSPTEIEVFPNQIVLDHPRSQQQLVVTLRDTAGSERDWTRQARYRIVHPEIANLTGGVLTPVADGQTELIVEVGNQRCAIPVQVTGSQQSRPVEFETEVLLALCKQGCNSGACHGSPSGKGGFRLSLRAFDVQFDQLTLIREDFGRRVNTLEPEQSLLLQKPMMKVPHGGRKQLHVDDVAYKILREWIGEGASSDPADAPRISHLDVYPAEKKILDVSSGGMQLAVTANYTNGTRRDVTALVSYESSDNNVATVDASGRVTPRDRGEVAILVRSLEIIEAVPLMFVDPQEGFQWQAPPENNYVDTLVNEKLQQLQYPPAESCSDAEFLRRSSLDVIGILPSIEESTSFLADESPDKRARWIDSLLERPEYAKFWALKWGDLLKMTSKLVGNDGVFKYHRWVEQSLRVNQPYDLFARELLTSSGSTLANPPANFYRTAADMHESVETISQVFLGARLQCAQVPQPSVRTLDAGQLLRLGSLLQPRATSTDRAAWRDVHLQ